MTTQTTHQRLATLTGTRDFADLPNSCRCGDRWSGTNTCHCGATGCHQTFVGVGAFDRHRRGGQCANPAAIGMVTAPGRAYEAWTTVDQPVDQAGSAT
jgi:hypothetical protein